VVLVLMPTMLGVLVLAPVVFCYKSPVTKVLDAANFAICCDRPLTSLLATMAKTLILLIALLACAAEDAVTGLKFEDGSDTTCLIKKDGNDIVAACGDVIHDSEFRSIISGDTVQDPAIPVLEDAVKNLHNAFCADVLHSTTTPAYGGDFTHSKNNFCQYNCVAGEYSRAGNEDILIGDPGSKCPAGYSTIHDEDVCEVAMQKLGLSSSDSPVDEFHDMEDVSDWPSGCYFINGVYGATDGTWFNDDTTLSDRAGVQLYCAKDSWYPESLYLRQSTDPVVKEDKCMTCRTECDAVGYTLGVDCDGTTTADRPCTQCLADELPTNAVWTSKEDCSWECDSGFREELSGVNVEDPLFCVSDCIDDPDWLYKSGSEKDCAWAGGRDSKCSLHETEDDSNPTGYESCRSSCGCAASKEYHGEAKDGCVVGC
jgi:hypothetical protein